MTKTQYLYSYWKPLRIPQAVIDDRVRILNAELREELGLVAYSQRIGDLIKAIKFWETINDN